MIPMKKRLRSVLAEVEDLIYKVETTEQVRRQAWIIKAGTMANRYHGISVESLELKVCRVFGFKGLI